MSDADLVPPDLGPERCWLGALSELMDRHADFGMVGCRIEGLPMPEWHRLGGPDTKIVDGEIIEGPTGVWLNMIRRDAFRVPFQSDGMTCHALTRAGFRIGVGVELLCEHLGDLDPQMFPDYLARKNAANGFGSVYLEYPELREVRRPPTLVECALAAPVIALAEESGIPAKATVELSQGSSLPILSAVIPEVQSVAINVRTARDHEYAVADEHAPWADASVPAVAVFMLDHHDELLLAEAYRIAEHTVFVLTLGSNIEVAPGFTLREKRPPNDAVLQMCRLADRSRRVRKTVGYSTLERQQEWLSVFRAACFGARRLRLYVLERDQQAAGAAAPAPTCRNCGGSAAPRSCRCGILSRRGGPRPYRPPFSRTLVGALGARVTQAVRAVLVELRLRSR